MKYFTKGLWRAAQQLDTAGVETRAEWLRASEAYRADLDGLSGRVSNEAHSFFAEADIHDAELLDLHIVDGSRAAPLGEPARPWQSLTPYPVLVELTVLDAWDRNVWRLVYSSTRTVLVDYPSGAPLFTRGVVGFDDLGYHELTDAGDGFLRHEYLFSSGAVLASEFKDVEISSMPARERPQQPTG